MWSINSAIFSIFLVFFFPILILVLYLIIFRSNPFTGFMKDWDELDAAIAVALEEKERNPKTERKEDPDDYWEYEDGEAYAYSRPTVRHPKNRNRAYESGSQRFDDGGW